ncbi:MAG: hypothetical protein EP339_11350 [Gammaproteobacteria bacterium]|uniref:Uncharacterized protein n=1 Tax=Marinobacter nitratireducens TaxID=1137280 RepID=A0A072MYP2_9GAMM|nr:hypothetical protein [Marinobacter nitratireducens]KEF30087.1 hypothetical protein D777_03263 [Marinobacter nitratireducens]TNE74007.1 MAG: hypothetical protein EP339_11350 [Gammaproteobacteria bacterium]TNE95920.1 MAG: hypothetical protein EP328_09060 [Gammaproteobacteria bacterium]
MSVRYWILLALMIGAAQVSAGETYESGFSSGVINDVPEKHHRSKVSAQLEQQATTGQPDEGELAVGVFVDTQARIAETFRRPVPDQMLNETRGE